MPAVARCGSGNEEPRSRRAASRAARPRRDVGQRLARAHRDAGAHAAERHARAGARRARRARALRCSAAVRMITSHGAPATSFSRIAPTAPNVPSIGGAGGGGEMPAASAVDEALAPRPREQQRQQRHAARARRASLVRLRAGDLHDALPLDDVVGEVAARIPPASSSSAPRPASPSRRAPRGGSTIFVISALSRLTIAGGVPFGAMMPSQITAS